MAWSNYKDKEDKAGWNASEEIIKTLSNLRNTYLSCKLDEKFPKALEVIRAILDIISGKVKDEEIDELNEQIYSIEEILPKATETYVSDNGLVIKAHPKMFMKVKRDIEILYREVERLQNDYGFGMISQDDPRFAVEMR